MRAGAQQRKPLRFLELSWLSAGCRTSSSPRCPQCAEATHLVGQRSWRQASCFCVALGPVPLATLTPAAAGECGPCQCWGSEPWPCICRQHDPRPQLRRARTYLLCSHAGAFPIVQVILQVAVPYAKLELLQEGFVLHEIQCIEHVEPFLQGRRETQEQVKREKSCLAFPPVSTTSQPYSAGGQSPFTSPGCFRIRSELLPAPALQGCFS